MYNIFSFSTTTVEKIRNLNLQDWSAIAGIVAAILVIVAPLKNRIPIFFRRLLYCGRTSLNLVRNEQDTTPVYAVIGQKKRHIATESTLFALGYKQSDVQWISQEEINKYEEGTKIIKDKLREFFAILLSFLTPLLIIWLIIWVIIFK